MRKCGDFPFQGFLPANTYLLVKPLGVVSHMNQHLPALSISCIAGAEIAA
jgi:hypothetical protein